MPGELNIKKESDDQTTFNNPIRVKVKNKKTAGSDDEYVCVKKKYVNLAMKALQHLNTEEESSSSSSDESTDYSSDCSCGDCSSDSCDSDSYSSDSSSGSYSDSSDYTSSSGSSYYSD